MNRLAKNRRTQVFRCLVEDDSARATVWVSKNAIQKLLAALGPACGNEKRYSPAERIGCQVTPISSNPNPRHISASFVERQNLMRMQVRRFTRLTNAFAKKAQDLGFAITLHFMHCNFCRVHQTLRVPLPMEAGISHHVWGIDEIVALLDSCTARGAA